MFSRRRTGVAAAQLWRGQHPQIISVAHRPANAGMSGAMKIAGRILCPMILCQYSGLTLLQPKTNQPRRIKRQKKQTE
jgi:hypothetical protein